MNNNLLKSDPFLIQILIQSTLFFGIVCCYKVVVLTLHNHSLQLLTYLEFSLDNVCVVKTCTIL